MATNIITYLRLGAIKRISYLAVRATGHDAFIKGFNFTAAPTHGPVNIYNLCQIYDAYFLLLLLVQTCFYSRIR